MNERTLRTLTESGRVKQLKIIADGALFHVCVVTAKPGTVTAMTGKGSVKTWGTLDAADKWVRSLWIGKVQLDILLIGTHSKSG
jgi:hypothetical protein